MKRCDIVIPVWNQLDVTKRCIESILKNTDHPYRLIIIDNASDHDTADYLDGLRDVLGPDMLLIRNEKNAGFVKAINQGLSGSDAGYICVANNDIVVTDGWLAEMMGIIEADKTIGLLNPACNTSGQSPDEGESLDDYAAGLKRFKGTVQELYTCRGYCMIIRREVINALGPLDDIYHFGYFDDTDYCKRAQALGFRTALAKGAYVYHAGGVSFKKLEDSGDLFKKNERIFYGRWGRQVRVGYFVDRVADAGRIDNIARLAALGGHQIWVYLRKGDRCPVTLDHYDIKKVYLNPYFFSAVSFYKILKRKKKKRIDVVLTDNVAFGRVLKMTAGLHGSVVLVRACDDDLKAVLAAKSKDF